MTVVGFIDVICKILTFNYTKMRLAARWGSLQHSPDPLAGF